MAAEGFARTAEAPLASEIDRRLRALADQRTEPIRRTPAR